MPKKGDLRDCSNAPVSTGKVLHRILLEGMKEAVYQKLCDQQAGFIANRSCAPDSKSVHHYRAISGVEIPSPSYVNFIDYEKAFNRVDLETLWKIMRNHGISEKLISLIRNTYQGMICRVGIVVQMSENFKIKTEVRQRCLLSPFL
ncbi:uncharacterized protein LOC134268113 [Saccostrea cucullata]|uniref:uncharacterized protein LOC134268113 n=1 Tax=Saccostrea cuccullata TaxID=36930 RepID=UPI002ED5D6C4